jgi:hypothetical protein
MIKMKILLLLTLVISTYPIRFSEVGQHTETPPTFEARILAPLIGVRVKGKQTLVYELYVSNVSHKAFTIKSFEVIDSEDSDVLGSYNGNDINARLSTFDDDNVKVGPAKLFPGQFAIIYIELTLNKRKFPTSIFHR